MGVEIRFSQSYLWLNSWVLANILQLATQSFCERFIDYKIDPSRRLYDQMVMAARCGVANIAEGTARNTTSIETEMRLIDVARASFDELQGDLFNYMLRRNAEIWIMGHPDREAIWRLNLDTPHYSNNLLHDAAIHILNQKRKFDYWIENQSSSVSANAMLVLCEKINRMLQSQLENLLEKFRVTGGFTENMTVERLEARRIQSQNNGAPTCPVCGKPMVKRMIKKGQGHGCEFWGCIDFPKCRGSRNC